MARNNGPRNWFNWEINRRISIVGPNLSAAHA
jgi:hypothetical protein